MDFESEGPEPRHVGVFRALLIDLDGTLVDSNAAVEGAWAETLERFGLPPEPFAPYLHGIPAPQALRMAYPDLADDRVAAVAEHGLAEQAAPHRPVTLVPGVEQLLGALGSSSWAIVTSGDARLARASMAKVQIPEPPVLVTADDVRKGKPDPEPYLMAAAALAVDPRDCLVVEDSPAGLAAGRAAGMRILAVTTTYAPQRLEGADWIVPDLRRVEFRAVDGGRALWLD